MSGGPVQERDGAPQAAAAGSGDGLPRLENEPDLPPLILRRKEGPGPGAPSSSADLSSSLDEVQTLLEKDAEAEKARVDSLLRERSWGDAPAPGAAQGSWSEQAVLPPAALAPPPPVRAPVPDGTSPFGDAPAGRRPGRSSKAESLALDPLSALARQRQRKQRVRLLLYAGGAALLAGLLGLSTWLVVRAWPAAAPPPDAAATAAASREAAGTAAAAAPGSAAPGTEGSPPAAGTTPASGAAAAGAGGPAPGTGGPAVSTGAGPEKPAANKASSTKVRRHRHTARAHRQAAKKPRPAKKIDRPRSTSEVDELLKGL